jgi:hypothetical protein
MAVPVYSWCPPGVTRALASSAGGTLLRPAGTPPDPLTDALLAALPTGSVWFDPRYGFNPTLHTWTDRKSGIAATLCAGSAMPTLAGSGINGQAAVVFGSSTAGGAMVCPGGNALFPLAGDYTAAVVLQSTDNASAKASGTLLGNARSDASTTSGTITGCSKALYLGVSNSVVALQHQTKAGATTNAALLQSATGDAESSTRAQLWVSSYDYAGSAAALYRNGSVNKATQAVATRRNENAQLVLAGNYDGSAVSNALRNASLGLFVMVPGLAVHKSGSANAALLAALQAYASGKLNTH